MKDSSSFPDCTLFTKSESHAIPTPIAGGFPLPPPNPLKGTGQVAGERRRIWGACTPNPYFVKAVAIHRARYKHTFCERSTCAIC